MGKTNSKIKYVIASFLLVAAVIIANAVFGGVFAEGITITQNGSRLVVNAEDDESVQWMRADSADGAYEPIVDATEKYYDLTAEDSNKYIKVVAGGKESSAPVEIGKVVVMDIGKGAISLGATYSGKDSDGIAVSGPHEAGNIYIIRQNDNTAKTANKISFSGNTYTIPYDVTLDGVNMGLDSYSAIAPDQNPNNTNYSGMIEIPNTSGNQKDVTIRLKGDNIVRAIHYYTPGGNVSKFKITDINGDGKTDGGSLYIPEKIDEKDIDEFVKQSKSYNHWNAGIGGDDSSATVTGLEIAGGFIQVLTTYGDNCTAIGAGGNGSCTMKITGGKIVAHCSGTGAAIGGGIGWHSQGGISDVTITGGDIEAENHGKIYVRATYNADGSISGTTIVDKEDGYNEIIGGVAIGSGSSVKSGGAEGKVTITGGTVKATGAYGNGIGGGNSSSGSGGKATIEISGDATVSASSIGGGNSKKNTGGSATVTIGGNANINLINGIGGGSSDSGNGGDATITVISGTINCGDVIGGGNGGGTGNGGKATIKVSGGVLTSKSIGGGTGSEGGNGGAAKIIISGGTITTGSIGGGDTLNKTDGKIGNATADISGGDISGQFLLMAGGTEPCYFKMTGGTLHGVNTADDSEYSYAKLDGAAVYMDDPSGTVTISGGTIKDCSAENGGAIYMTAGSFELSGTGSISGNTATESGGAIYLGGGTVTINGGEISGNIAAENGGGAYLEDGKFSVTGGIISGNTAAENGGGAYLGGGILTVDGGTVSSNSAKNGGGAFVEGGQVLVFSGKIEDNTAEINGGGFDINNGSFGMTGGSVNKNEAKTGSGGGIYVSANDEDVVVDVLSGSVSNNRAAENGGALAVVGDKESENKITVTIGVDGLHNNVKCHHGGNYIDENVKFIEDCPQTNANHAGQKGGAFFVTGNNQKTTLNVYCLIEEEANSAGSENGQSNFMKVEGGRVLVTTSKTMDEDDKTSQNDYNGNISIKSTIYVTGGDFDIWGKMINPDIAETITVDIVNPETDEFDDNRINDSDAVIVYYKLLYYENFEDPKTGQTTGQYKEVRVLKGEAKEILGNIYVHPGYTIQGWNTKPKDYDNTLKAKLDDNSGYTKENDAQGWYEVGSKYDFNGYCRGDLVIYAIWKANGYTVAFDANVPVGETVYGTMADVNLTFNQPENLPANTYSRSGYEFISWNTEPEGTGKPFADKELVENLTTGSELVTLYAQWEKCAHENPEKYIYTLIENGKGIKLECSCGGYSETVILSAKDTVYNREEQPAELKRSTTDSGIEPKLNPEIKYSKQNSEGEYELIDGVPKNAGTYKASITAGGKTASIVYIIEKAEQPAPPKPNFAIGNDTKSLTVKQVPVSPIKDSAKPEYDETYDSVRQYMLVYYDVDGIEQTIEWESAEENIAVGADAWTFDLEYALTNYSVYARYSEGKNYKASPATKADGEYFYAGNVGLKIIAGEGIKYIQQVANEVDGVVNGIQIDISLEEGYYFPKEYNVTIKRTDSTFENEEEGVPPFTATPYKQYNISSIPRDCYMVVTFPDAVKIPTIEANITEKQVFEAFEDSDANISRDSAFTVNFDVHNFNTRDYSKLVLDFKDAEEEAVKLPKGTKIILQNREPEHFGYYSEIVYDAEGKSEFDLSVFGRMGVKEANPDNSDHKFALYDGNMLLNVVVDFSEAENKLAAETVINPVLTAEVAPEAVPTAEGPETQAEGEGEAEPEPQSEDTPQVGPVEVTSGTDIYAKLYEEAKFGLEIGGNGISNVIKYNYDDSDGEASIWDNRDTAIVIKKNENEGKELPADAHIVFVKDGYRTETYPNANEEFIFPTEGPESGEVEIYLVSNLINGEEYKFDVMWKTAESIAETSPTNGNLNDKETVNLEGRTSISPSIKITERENKRLFKIGDDLSFNAYVEWENLVPANKIKIALMKKVIRDTGASEFVDTGFKWNMDNEINISENSREKDNQTFEITLPSSEPASYCIRITLFEELVAVSEANYYFIIE